MSLGHAHPRASAATHRAARAALAAALLLASVTGCLPNLTAESAPPPGRAARLDEITGFWGNVLSYRLELSQGIALAVSCSSAGPCEQLTATADDPAIAEVRPASLDVLRPAGYFRNQQPATAVVVIGKRAGTTTIRLRSQPGDREIRVTVVAPAATVTAARR